MTAKPIALHRLARNEASAAHRHYRLIDKTLARRFDADLERELALIERKPDLLAPDIEGTRKRLLADFPFYVIYVETPDVWLITAIAHVRRRPNYWRKRLQNP